MLLGYNTNGFASHRFDDALRVIAELGYRSVGITLDHHALDPYRADLERETARVSRLLADLGLAPVVETGARFLLDRWRKHQPGLLDPEPAARARRLDFLERAIEVAAAIGAGVVSLFSGVAPAPAGRDPLDDRLAEGLERLCARAEERGVVLGLEPEPGMHVESMADFDRIAARVPAPALALTLDVGHAYLTELEGAEAIVRRYAGRIVNVHLEGMRRPDHEHLPPWEGDLDVRGVVRALEEVGYRGPATFELPRHSHAAVEVARRALEFLALTPAPRS